MVKGEAIQQQSDQNVVSDESALDLTWSTDNENERLLQEEQPEKMGLFFGAELNALQREHVIRLRAEPRGSSEEEDDDDGCSVSTSSDEQKGQLSHLYLRQVALGGDARPDERNILSVESRSVSGLVEEFVVASLAVGVQEMAVLNLDFEMVEEVVLRLVEGSGTMCVTGKQVIWYPDLSEEEEEDEQEVEDEVKDESEITEVPPASIKRRKEERQEDGVLYRPPKKRRRDPSSTDEAADDYSEGDDSEEDHVEGVVDLREKLKSSSTKTSKDQTSNGKKKKSHPAAIRKVNKSAAVTTAKTSSAGDSKNKTPRKP